MEDPGYGPARTEHRSGFGTGWQVTPGTSENSTSPDRETKGGETKDGPDEDGQGAVHSASDQEGTADTEGASENQDGRPKNRGMTPGERLAAAKAKKAKRKRDARGRQAEDVEEKALEGAAKAGEWLDRNRRWIIGGALTLALALCGYLLWAESERSTRRQMALTVQDALSGGSQDEAEEATEPQDSAEREKAALEAALAGGDLGVLKPWVQLAVGARALRLEQLDEAKEAFSAALTAKDTAVSVQLRAREGLVFVAEQQEDWPTAETQLEALENADDPTLQDVAAYHRARLAIREQDAEQAKEVLSSLVDRRDSDRSEAPDLPYLENQARVRLSELDPSFSDTSLPSLNSLGSLGGPSISGPNGEALPPEILEMLRQRANQAAE